MRRMPLYCTAGLFTLALTLACGLLTTSQPAAAHGEDDFTLVEVIGNLDRPTGVEVAPNGDVFIIEKNGLLKVFDGFDDSSADVVVNWWSRTMHTGDQGMLGLAVDPGYGSGRNYVYVQYVLDALPGENNPPHWNDNCPAARTTGCPVTSTIARIEVNPNTNDLVGWTDLLTSATCLQFNGHSANDLAFGPDGYLYASIGDGASYVVADYGQLGDNPCQDPPYPAQPTTANGQGGALRSMDLLTSVGGEAGDPVWYNGVVLRIDPDTGQAAPGNPLNGGPVAGDDRIIAHGLRNPWRIDFRPGTQELWIADVGWTNYEELNVIANPVDAVVENFGWPCYEGPQPHAIYSQYGLCQTLNNDPGSFVVSTQLTQSRMSYAHSSAVGTCGGGSSSLAGLAFVTGGPYPAEYDGALFFTDYARGCLWAMLPNAAGVPDPGNIETVATGVIIVDLDITPSGELLVVEVGDFADGSGRVRRLDFLGQNSPPTAVIAANTLTGTENETVFRFDGSGSTDPEQGTLTYQWDLDGDGDFDQSGQTASIVYSQPGSYQVRLRVTDPEGSRDEATVTVNVSNTAPVATITSPSAGTTWRVGDEIAFSGTGTDAEDGTLQPGTPGQEWEWRLILHHCPSSDCHQHIEGSWSGVSGGRFGTPDHEYPSWLELVLVVYDGTGSSSSASVELQPSTSTVTLASDPPGLMVAGGGSGQQQTAPYPIEAIEGGSISITAPSPQTVGGVSYVFESWSDGGARSHDVVVQAADTTITADFVPTGSVGFADGWTGVSPSGGWSYWWNQGGPIGRSASYSRLQWNGTLYDSDGAPGQPSADEFAFGSVGPGTIHPGRGTNQGAADDRHAIVRYTVGRAGSYGIVGSELSDLGCVSAGVELTVLVNDRVVSRRTHSGSAPSSFDGPLGSLSSGDTIDVAVGPDIGDICDSTSLDFFIDFEPAAAAEVVVASYSKDFAGPSPSPGWSYLWNERGPIGQPSGYSPLLWNTYSYDSDGQPGSQSGDEFVYGQVARWGMHPGRGTGQRTNQDRFAIARYTVSEPGPYRLVDAVIADRGCTSGGVELQVRVNNSLIQTMNHAATVPASFDTALGDLSAGDVIDVAVGPDGVHVCDAVDVDFTIVRGGSAPPPPPPPPPTTVTVGRFGDNRGQDAANRGWTFWWNRNGALGNQAGYERLLWNGSDFDSDGLAGYPSADEFSYGRVAPWGVHPGRGTGQGAGHDRSVIVRYSVTTAGVFEIVDSLIDDIHCASAGGVTLEILVNNSSVYSAVQAGPTTGGFDRALGLLSPGDTIDVAVGPNQFDWCDATDLDFTLVRRS